MVEDIDRNTGKFISSVNMLLAKRGFLQSYILDRLVNSFCTSFYGAQLWDLNNRWICKFFVSWQTAVRRLWKLPNTTLC